MSIVNWTDTRESYAAKLALQPFNSMMKDMADVPPSVGDRVYDLLMGKYMDHVSKLPAQMFNHSSGLTLYVASGSSFPALNIKFSGSRPTPLDSTLYQSDGYLTKRYYSGHNFIMLDHPDWGDLGEELKAISQKLNEFDAEIDRYRRELKKLINANRRIAATIKVWPPIKNFLDGLTINKLEQEPKTKLRSVKHNGADLEFLTAMAVRGRMFRV